MLFFNWWNYKVFNFVVLYIIKVMFFLVCWELWRFRCSNKYGFEKLLFNRFKVLIIYFLFYLLYFQFGKVRVGESWKSICYLCDVLMIQKFVVLVRWIKLLLFFVKFNSDGSCRDGICGGGGVVRDSMGVFIMVYFIFLGVGISNWVEVKVMFFGFKWCIERRYRLVIGEIDFLLLLSCIL